MTFSRGAHSGQLLRRSASGRSKAVFLLLACCTQEDPLAWLNISDTTEPESPLASPARECGNCHRNCNRLTRAGLCRGCKADSDLAARINDVRTELGPDATPEQIATRPKQLEEERRRRRLTARVRRVMEAGAGTFKRRDWQAGGAAKARAGGTPGPAW